LFLLAVHNVHYADGLMLIITAQASKMPQVKGKDHELLQADAIDDKECSLVS
jgi:hypothetical protein